MEQAHSFLSQLQKAPEHVT